MYTTAVNRTILLIEDNAELSEFLVEFLSENRYTVHGVRTGVRGRTLFYEVMPDLVILDLTLPDVDGESLCREFKKDYPEIPIIILTAKDDPKTLARNLENGADDYISKPFATEELLARIQSRLREKSSADPLLRAADITINTETYEVTRAGKLRQLTQTEFELLRYLMEHKNKVLSREMILSRVWATEPDIETRVVDVYIGYLRKKLDKGFTRKLIHSKRGFGYMLQE